MKSIIKNIKSRLYIGVALVCCLTFLSNTLIAQDSTVTTKPVKTKVIGKPVKNTFASTWI